MTSNPQNYPVDRQFGIAEIPAFFLELSEDGIITRSNPFSERLTGKSLPHLDYREVVVDFEGSLNPFALADDRAERVLLSINTFTGLPQSLYCDFYRIGNRAVILGSVDPVEQEHMRLQLSKLNQQLGNITRELQKANVELEHLNNLKSQFLGMAAHDLRKPTGVVQGFSELLLEDTRDGLLTDEHRDYLERIHRNATFMRQLIDDFLDVAIIESGKFKVSPEPVSLGEILDHVLEIVMIHSRRKNVPVTVQDGAGDLGLLVDAPKIEQVLINLISNAIEHSEPESPVRITWTFDEDTLSLAVEDHGVGIPLSKQKHLFNPYQSGLSRKTGGESSTGLGLVISRKIAEAHNGSLSIESEEGKGATFVLHLPRHLL